MASRHRHRAAHLQIPDVARTVLWGLSCANGRTHVVDPGVEHRALVYLARCGHRLLRRSTLHEVPPARRCPACGEGTSR
jgi:hypothetical protein